MSVNELIQEQPTTMDASPGGEQSPPATIDNAILVEHDTDGKIITTVRDGTPNQTGLTPATAPETTTTEQAPTTSEQTTTTTVTQETTAIAEVNPTPPAHSSGIESAAPMAGILSLPLFVAGAIRRLRHKK